MNCGIDQEFPVQNLNKLISSNTIKIRLINRIKKKPKKNLFD